MKGGTPKSTKRRVQEDHWLEIPATLLAQDGVIRLREPAETDLFSVLQRIRDGSYQKPFVLDDGMTRRLHFDFKAVQSEMCLKDPNKLVFAYTQKMMAFLLFLPDPKHVVIVGLGGGSLTKFCGQQLPRTKVTTVEIDANIIGLSSLFDLPPPSARMPIVHADAVDYFETSNELADVILIDGCDEWGTTPTFCQPAFHEQLRRRLRPEGVLVVNLIDLKDRSGQLLRTVKKLFTSGHTVLKVQSGGNHVLFAFNDPDGVPDWQRINRRAKLLEQQHGLDFRSFARQLQRNYQQWKA